MNAMTTGAPDNKAALRTAKQVVTPKARLNFAHLFTPRQRLNQGELVYQCVLVFDDPRTDLTALRNAAAAAAKEKWGADWIKWSKLSNFKKPLRRCEEKDDRESFPAGCWFMTTWSKNQPGMVDQANRPILSEKQLYSGCYVYADVNAFAFDQQGSKGVSFGLNNIQKVADGERLDGRRDPTQVFKPIEGYDPGTGGGSDNPLDDEIPF
jgi:hypothetical protein